tara:strand:+ start:219 stop:983 length:765 start_codon:yes stop_codon:yes gene_type:complete
MNFKYFNSQLPVIILLGGKGSRFSEITQPPKQLVKLNKTNLIISILKYYNKYKFNYFLLPLGYKKNFFYKFFNDKKIKKKYKLNVILNKNKRFELNPKLINIQLFNTKENATKLERIKKSTELFNNEFFLVTYGDGLANINFENQLKFFRKRLKNLVTIYRTKSQYGHFDLNKNYLVKYFKEKPFFDLPINIGYYIFNKKDFTKFYNKKNELEKNFLPKLIRAKSLYAYNHKGFFFNIDNKKDLVLVKKKFKGV